MLLLHLTGRGQHRLWMASTCALSRRLIVPGILGNLWLWHCTQTIVALLCCKLHHRMMTVHYQQHPAACGLPSWLRWLGLLLRHTQHLLSLSTYPQHALCS